MEDGYSMADPEESDELETDIQDLERIKTKGRPEIPKRSRTRIEYFERKRMEQEKKVAEEKKKVAEERKKATEERKKVTVESKMAAVQRKMAVAERKKNKKPKDKDSTAGSPVKP
ncbi:uncharacterized protein [Miscanthus floridulus]|uniref:uncharacterized protein n=1 Tax=Miscanthus floridulus TaxID=154761 RepID=UPI003457989C